MNRSRPAPDAVLRIKKAIDPEIFKKDVLQSKTGQSKCCETCGNAECRTVDYADETHEAIPADLIVRAGLIAAAYAFKLKPPQTGRRIPLLRLKPRKV